MLVTELAGAPLPERPLRERANPAEVKPFDGVLEEQDDREGYVRIVFGNLALGYMIAIRLS